MPWVWLNGELLEASEARVSVLDRGLLWGYGLFETIRAYSGRLWAFDEHDERLRAGARVLEIDLPARRILREGTERVVEANHLSEAGIRVTVTRGAGPPDPAAEPSEPPNAFVTGWPLEEPVDLYERGAALVTLSGGGRPLGGVKTTSYAASVAGRIAARRAGADDGLFVGTGGEVLEGTSSNVFAVFGETLVTPPVGEEVLAGITRRVLLETAPEAGFRTEVRRLRLEELSEADEVLLTSSLREVYPARSLDGEPLARAGTAARLRTVYREAVRARLGL